MQPRILPLSEDAISQIHSSKQITSLPGVVLALITNALDADATKVDISVSFARGSCTVEDNGCGIPPAEFAEHGGLGKMHHTSQSLLLQLGFATIHSASWGERMTNHEHNALNPTCCVSLADKRLWEKCLRLVRKW